MKKVVLVPTLFFLCFTWSTDLAGQMNNRKIEKIIKEEAEDVGGETGAWHLHLNDRVLLIITDEANNRMRIFTPIIEEKRIDTDEMYNMLVANFHTALDAKYSIYEGFVISTFTHPLKELTEAQLKDAMLQVVTLAETFGTTYSSTDLYFPGGGKDEEKENEGKEVKPAQGRRS